MGGTILAVAVISAVHAALAAILVIVDRKVNRYGECAIDINDGGKRVTVEGGRSLLESLRDEKIFIPSACGGRGTCGECRLKVREGGGPLLPTEEPYLEETQREAGMRLACQVKVKNDIRIEIPEALFSVSEFSCVCAEIEDLTHDMKRFRLELKEPAGMNYVPGQYVQLRCPAYDGNEEVYRAYSIASDPADRNVVELIIRLVPGGICTTWCFERLREGDEVVINGPYGEFRLSDTDAPMIFIAGGSGIAPFRCMLHHMRNTKCGRQATFYFGANRVRELCLIDTMEAFEEQLENVSFVPVVAKPAEDEKWDGETGLVTEAVARAFDDLAGHEGYLCGSPGMIDASVEVLKELGMREESIFYDKFE